MDVTPEYGDSDNTLLFKIAKHFAGQCPGTKCPRYGDSNNTLLFKIAHNLSTCGSISVPPVVVPPTPLGELIWSKLFDGAGAFGGYDAGKSIAVDSQGNVIVCGYSDAATTEDFYTVKYSVADGSVLWEARYSDSGASQYGIARAVRVDSNDDVIVTGSTDGAVSSDIYTAKYSSATGALLWEVRYDSPSTLNDFGFDLAIDSANNVVVAGSSNHGGSTNFYTAKYAAANGALIWQVEYDGPGAALDVAVAIAIDSNDNVVVTGPSNGGTAPDFYTAKYAAANGALLWEVRYDNSLSDVATGIAIDSNDNVIVTGHSQNVGPMDFDFYTAKYAAANGALLWEVRYDNGFTDNSAKVAVDSNDNVVVTGYSDNGSDSDFYTAKYAAANGALLWEVRYNSANGNDIPLAIALDSVNDVIVAGYRANGTGGTDFYVVKYAAATGALIWERSYSGNPAGSSYAAAVTVDANDNVAVTGVSDNGVDTDIYTVTYTA